MTDERNDHEILGRALARAIEAQPVRETPYEASRLAARGTRRGGFPLWQLSAAAAALVLALAFGSWFTRPTEPGPVAASSTPTPGATPSTAPSISPTAPPREQTVFVARDGLPPLATKAPGGDPSAPIEERIRMRVEALNKAVSGLSGTTLDADPKRFYVRSVTVQGDLATIDYSAPFPPGGSAEDVAITQQIVFTATEEAEVTRVLVTENGRPMSTGHLLWQRPLTRDDVDGYDTKVEAAIVDPGTADVPPSQLAYRTSFSVDSLAPGLARFVIEVGRTGAALPRDYFPAFDAKLVRIATTDQSGLPGEAAVWVTVPGLDPKVGTETVDRSPLRSINTVHVNGTTVYQLKLDTAYPWRVLTLANPTRIVIDVGGHARSVSDRIAVYGPRPGTLVARTFTLSGASRTFEANVVWRVKDPQQRVVANGFTTASLGTSPVWGAFSTQVTLPASVSGNVTLEVFEASPKDGSELGLVAIPLTVR